MPNDRQYEFVYVLAPTMANAELETLQRELGDHVRKLGGAVENTDVWGRRKLAYPIDNFTEGIYVVQLIRGPGAMVTELERRMRVHDDVLRYLTVRVDDDLRKAQRAAEKRKADAERRRVSRESRGGPAPPPESVNEAPSASGPPAESGPPPAEGAPPVSEDASAAAEPAPPEGEPSSPASASDEPAG